MDYDGATRPRSPETSPSICRRAGPRTAGMIAYTSYRNGNPDLFVLNFDSGRRDVLSAQAGVERDARPGRRTDSGWSSP